MIKRFGKDNLAFAGVLWFLWSGFAAYYGFFVPFLKSNGFSELNIGFIMSTLSFIGIFGPILWGAVSDKLKSARVLLMANILAGCIVAQFVPGAVGRFGLLLIILVTVNITIFAQAPVLDGWAMRLKSRGAHINYGLIRGVGSLAYACASMLCGVIFERYGMGMMFPFFLVVECAAAALLLLVRNRPGPPPVQQPKQSETAHTQLEETPLYRNTAYITFVFLTMMLYFGQTSAMTFYPVLLQQAGGTNADLGLALGLMALSEFPFMFLSSQLLRKFRDTTLLVFSMGFFALRIFLFFAAAGSVTGLVWAQMTNSMSFGIFLPTSVHYISRIAPDRYKGTALSIASAMYMGVGGIVGSALGGVIINAVGVRPLFGWAALLAAAVTTVFGLTLLRKRRRAAREAGSLRSV